MRLFLNLLVVLSLANFNKVGFAEPTTMAMKYQEVVDAFQKIVAGRTLKSDEGSEIRYGGGLVDRNDTYLMRYDHTFASGREAKGKEAVWTDGRSIYVDQVVDQVIARRYIASIEGPFNVLRIRPDHPDDSDFIGRDCIRRSESEGTICYVKVRYMNDVITSTYREEH